MNLRRIRHALALAEALNYARAAEQLHLSQPALSRSIQLLEEELGLALFDRDKRQVRVTAVGAQFLARAARLAQEARSLQRDMALVREGRLGRLSFGAGPYPMASLVPALLASLRQSHPDLAVSLVQDAAPRLLQQLRDERIEFCIAERRDLPPDAELELTPLARLPVGFLVRSGHPLTRQAGAPRARELLPYGFASVNLPPSLQVALGKTCKLAHGEALPLALSADHMALLIAQAGSSDLVLLAPLAAVEREREEGRLQLLELQPALALYTEPALIHLRGRSLSPAAQLAIERLLRPQPADR